MAFELVAEGSVATLPDLPEYEANLKEGSDNMLKLQLSVPVSEGVAETLENALIDAGVANVSVTTGSPVLNIRWTKGFAWLPVIVAVILASILLAVIIVSWQLFTDIKETAPWAIPFLLIGGIVLLGAAGVYIARRA